MSDNKTLTIGNISIGNHLPMVLFAGMNVLEEKETIWQVAETLQQVTNKLGIALVFKASFDKANRSSISSFRGPGLKAGLKLLEEVKQHFNLPIITDIHEPQQAAAVAEIADIIQLPAFLSRQTDLIVSMAKTDKIIHIKKAQFLSAQEMRHIINKFISAGNDKLILCERGTCFGYNNLIVDTLNFGIMRAFNHPVTFDVTRALQLPGAGTDTAGGRAIAALDLAIAGISQQIAGLFLETHPNPQLAKCDGPCALVLDKLEPFLQNLQAIDNLVKTFH